MKNIKLLKIICVSFLILLSFYNSSLASNLSTHNDVEIGTAVTQTTYEVPCEISGIILMAETEEVCSILKEKISNHDHD